jgi:hypothetical protein
MALHDGDIVLNPVLGWGNENRVVDRGAHLNSALGPQAAG